MAGHGYIALIHNYNNEKMKAASEAKKAYDYVMDGFKYMQHNPEFYFSSGLYNYYMIRYPEDHPIVKPVVFSLKMEIEKRAFDKWILLPVKVCLLVQNRLFIWHAFI